MVSRGSGKSRIESLFPGDGGRAEWGRICGLVSSLAHHTHHIHSITEFLTRSTLLYTATARFHHGSKGSKDASMS